MEGDGWIYEEGFKELNRWSSVNDDPEELGNHLLISEGCKQSAEEELFWVDLRNIRVMKRNI